MKKINSDNPNVLELNHKNDTYDSSIKIHVLPSGVSLSVTETAYSEPGVVFYMQYAEISPLSLNDLKLLSQELQKFL